MSSENVKIFPVENPRSGMPDDVTEIDMRLASETKRNFKLNVERKSSTGDKQKETGRC